MSREERTARHKELIIKYGKELLTAKEHKDVMYWASLENSLTLSYMFLWIPLTFAFYAKYKQDMVANAIYRNRIVTIHLFQLPLLMYS